MTLSIKLNCGNCDLLPVTHNNMWFIEELFQYADVRRYYVLRADHAANIRSFCQYIISANEQMEALNFIIFNNNGDEVGFISAELEMNDETGMYMWNLGYAVHPSYRRFGYATAAVNGLTNYLLQNYSFPHVMLDISEDNHFSINVAQKCGFTKLNNNIGYFDSGHLEVGLRMRWFRQLEGARTIYFNQATHYYRQDEHVKALEAFKQALNEPYQSGTPYTDAQIYSNMGIVLSSLRKYYEAFQCLKKAQGLGLNNPSIERELNWLKNNVGLY